MTCLKFVFLLRRNISDHIKTDLKYSVVCLTSDDNDDDDSDDYNNDDDTTTATTTPKTSTTTTPLMPPPIILMKIFSKGPATEIHGEYH